MKERTYKGIDYGRGLSNVDSETKLRYGVIAQSSIMAEAVDDVYHGPHSKDLAYESWVSDIEEKVKSAVRSELEDYLNERQLKEVCEAGAEAVLDCNISDCYEGECYPHYEHDGYVIQKCLETDLFIIKSNYKTYAQFCSPCVPGACNLDAPLENKDDGNACYCLGHDWFDGGKAPYRVFTLEGSEVLPSCTR